MNCMGIYPFAKCMRALLIIFLASTNIFLDAKNDQIEHGELIFDDFFDHNDSPPSIRALTPADVIGIIELINGKSLLEEEFFLHTNPLYHRSVLDLPLFDMHHDKRFRRWSLSVQPFYTKMDKALFTKEDDRLSSYLALDEETLLAKLHDIFAIVQSIDPKFFFDTDLIFSLFKNVAVEQRRAGAMFQIQYRWQKFYLRFMIPLYYLERNFFLTEEELHDIEEEFGESTEEEQEEFKRKHVISDKLGIGDARIIFDTNVFKSAFNRINIGAFATIPTSFTIVKGIFGSTFARPSTFPAIDIFTIINELFDPTTSNEIQSFNTIRDLALNALDRLAANLLDIPLGNGRHLGVGMSINGLYKLRALIHRPWASKLQWVYTASIECLLPSHEKRFFMNNIDPALVQAQDFTNAALAQQNIDFINNIIAERFFLRAFDTSVWPGFIVRSSSQIVYKQNTIKYAIGTDSWLKMRDHVSINSVSQNVIDSLDIKKSHIPFAYQGNITASIVGAFARYAKTYHVGIKGYSTIVSRSIGKEYGISLTIQTDF